MSNINNINTPVNIRIKSDPLNSTISRREDENEHFLSTVI